LSATLRNPTNSFQAVVFKSTPVSMCTPFVSLKGYIVSSHPSPNNSRSSPLSGSPIRAPTFARPFLSCPRETAYTSAQATQPRTHAPYQRASPRHSARLPFAKGDIIQPLALRQATDLLDRACIAHGETEQEKRSNISGVLLRPLSCRELPV